MEECTILTIGSSPVDFEAKRTESVRCKTIKRTQQEPRSKIGATIPNEGSNKENPKFNGNRNELDQESIITLISQAGTDVDLC